jgi:hypothetical protein
MVARALASRRCGFNDLTHDEDQRKKVLLRKEAVLFFKGESRRPIWH